MKIQKTVLILSTLVFFLCSCKKSDDAPYLLFKDSNGQILNPNESLPVTLGSTITIYTEAGYEGDIKYEWKTDADNFKPYSALDGLNITSLGSSNNLKTQKATLTFHFPDQIYHPGSQVTIRISESTLSKSLIFNIE